jgi:hypothetical protein
MQILCAFVYTLLLTAVIYIIYTLLGLEINEGEGVLIGIFSFLIGGVVSAIYPGNSESVG